MLDKAHVAIVHQFDPYADVLDISPYGSGHINDTFLVLTQAGRPDYILQRVNHQVFCDVPKLMDNIVRVTTHIQHKLSPLPEGQIENRCLTVIPSVTGLPYFQDEQGQYWRMYFHIAEGRSFDLVTSPDLAYEGGKAFGEFQRCVADLPNPPLHETIPNFHHIDLRLAKLFDAIETDPHNRVQQVREECRFVVENRNEMRLVLQLGQAGKIPSRVTHNDTKFNNVLLDQAGKGLCVIDLDTVMPGYVHYDFSDSIRTVTNTAFEDETDLSKVSMDIGLFEAFSEGFFSSVLPSLTMQEKLSLPETVGLLPFIIGVRFLTDFLEGDVYFKTHYPEHNLQRAKVQFELVKSIQAQQADIERIFTRIMGG